MLYVMRSIVSTQQLAFSRLITCFQRQRVDITFANDYTVCVSSWSLRHDSEYELILGEMPLSTPLVGLSRAQETNSPLKSYDDYTAVDNIHQRLCGALTRSQSSNTRALLDMHVNCTTWGLVVFAALVYVLMPISYMLRSQFRQLN
jgi:hypothetical protein